MNRSQPHVRRLRRSPGALAGAGAVAVVLAACAAALWAAGTAPAAFGPPREAVGRTSFGLKLIAYRQLDPRLSELIFQTPNLQGETAVRVLTPASMDWSGATRYPVLYLLHGSYGDATSWTDAGGAEALTAGSDMLVVMPSSGARGGYVDWFDEGRFGPPRWETFHIAQLLPWIDANFPTVAQRSGRALAGLSMGGYGATEYAARHPDLFAAAESFSGAVDPLLHLRQPVTGNLVTPPGAYGTYPSDEGYVRGHDPVELAQNLRGIWIAMHTGDGTPSAACRSCADPLERSIHAENVVLHERLSRLGIAHVWDDYGAGMHTWAYWQSDLARALPELAAVFAHPAPVPAVFGYRSWDPSYSVWGWSVAVRRADSEFSALAHAGRHGFTLTGSGSATVATAGFFAPGRTVRVTIRYAGRRLARRVTADRRGRLVLKVPLGPSNRYDEYSPGARAGSPAVVGRPGASVAAGSPATVVYATRVSF